MKVISVAGKKTKNIKIVNPIFALYTPNNNGDLICLASYRNYWEAKNKFLEFKNNFMHFYNEILFVECSEQEYFKSIKKMNKIKSIKFLRTIFPF